MRKWNDDPFTIKARKENYEARSVYKLSEIDQRERVLQGVKRVLDLGASPGSWTQYCLQKLPLVHVIAVDLAPIRFTDPRLHFIHSSIEELDLSSHLGSQKVDLVLSDMAPKTSGIHDQDVARSIALAELALSSARDHLKPGGAFVVKVFMGDGFEEYHTLLKSEFETIRLLRPDSTRKHSREIFFVGKRFKKA